MRSNTPPCHQGSRQAFRLVFGVILAFVVVFSASETAWAARVVAPMCAPDGQSMPAPLRRTPTSDAKIRRATTCPTLDSSASALLPGEPSVPANWNLPACDPLWLMDSAPNVSSAQQMVQALDERKTPSLRQAGPGVYRPPRRSPSCTVIEHL